MFKNPFFKNKGPISISLIFKVCNFASNTKDNNSKISDVKNLADSTSKNITFFNSAKYKYQAKLTKAKFCITTENLKIYLPISCTPILVDNVLLSLSLVTKLFYPTSISDNFNNNLKAVQKSVI